MSDDQTAARLAELQEALNDACNMTFHGIVRGELLREGTHRDFLTSYDPIKLDERLRSLYAADSAEQLSHLRRETARARIEQRKAEEELAAAQERFDEDGRLIWDDGFASGQMSPHPDLLAAARAPKTVPTKLYAVNQHSREYDPDGGAGYDDWSITHNVFSTRELAEAELELYGPESSLFIEEIWLDKADHCPACNSSFAYTMGEPNCGICGDEELVARLTEAMDDIENLTEEEQAAKGWRRFTADEFGAYLDTLKPAQSSSDDQ